LLKMMVKTDLLGKILYPKLLWGIPAGKKEIFVTFDDGPHREITPKVLNILDEFNAKATFFCVGHNVEKFTNTYREIIAKGHQVGNHTYNHLKGWETSNEIYFENIKKCRQLVDSKLFRPPHGRIKRSQIKFLKNEYKIVMWSVLSYDFSKKVSKEKCLQISLKYTKDGSIIVFHDSEKAAGNMLHALPLFLEHFRRKGFVFKALTA
jgi:peptidoglycan-N-acetylglucosamine deacetylase